MNRNNSEIDQRSKEIPKDVYRHILTQMTVLSSSADFWPVRDLLLRHALDHLDTPEHDVMVAVSLCTTPAEGDKVRSLHPTMVVGHLPPGFSREVTPFLGAESLAGRAVTSGLPVIVHDTQEATTLPLPKKQHRSMIIYLLRRGSRIAGVLTVASYTPNVFLSSPPLIEEYASLMCPTYPESDFYLPQDIELRPMPPAFAQEPALSRFSEHLLHLSQKEQQEPHGRSRVQLERQAWRQIEAELLQLALS